MRRHCVWLTACTPPTPHPPPLRPACACVANRCVVTGPTGQCVFTGGSGGSVRVWDMRCDAPPSDPSAGEPVDDLALAPAAALLATLEAGGGGGGARSDVTALALSLDAATLAVGNAAGELSVWERPRGV